MELHLPSFGFSSRVREPAGVDRCWAKRETRLLSKPFKVVTNLDGFRANAFLGIHVPKRDF